MRRRIGRAKEAEHRATFLDIEDSATAELDSAAFIMVSHFSLPGCFVMCLVEHTILRMCSIFEPS